MSRYISILRGINVSGRNKILMKDLKALYEKLGFSNVTTYIQSGNVVFDADKKEADQQLAEKIKQAISQNYNFDIPVLVRTAAEIKNTLTTNPFLRATGVNPEKLHVTFLADLPDPANLTKLNDIHYPPDEFEIIGKDIFIHCPDKYGETKLSNKFFEGKLKVSATTRNWKTVNKLYEMACHHQ